MEELEPRYSTNFSNFVLRLFHGANFIYREIHRERVDINLQWQPTKTRFTFLEENTDTTRPSK